MKSRKGRFIPCGLIGKGDRRSNDLSSSSLGSWLEVVFKDKTCNTRDSAVQSWHVPLSTTVSAPSLSCKVIRQVVNLAWSQKMACHLLYKPNLSWREKWVAGEAGGNLEWSFSYTVFRHFTMFSFIQSFKFFPRSFPFSEYFLYL